MTRPELRLEILKLTYYHGRDTADAVGRARILEAYIDSQESPNKAVEPHSVSKRDAKNLKQSGNLDILR